MKILLSCALIVALISAAFSPVLAAKQPPQQQPQTEKPQQPGKQTPHRGGERRE